VAASFLRAHGYTLEAANWRRNTYEIDIIARKEQTLAFVEVKSARSDLYGPPQLNVHKRKQGRLITAAWEYISLLDWEPEEIRFDVIAITWPPGKSPQIDHIISAFTADNDG
jgi:putative endonuclease